MANIGNENKKTAKELLDSGHATMKELLTVSFGEWPPKGLDINPVVPHAQDVALNQVWKSGKTIGEMTMGERAIRVNLMIVDNIADTLGHEGIHILQDDNYFKADEIFGEEEARKIWQQQKDTASHLLMLELKAHDNKFNFLRHAFHAVAQRIHGNPAIGYLKEGDETQAYLHEALATGYKKWGKMPQDSAGLWQALVSIGLEPPADVKAYLKALPPDAPSRVFAKSASSDAGLNLNDVGHSLSRKET